MNNISISSDSVLSMSMGNKEVCLNKKQALVLHTEIVNVTIQAWLICKPLNHFGGIFAFM